MISVSAMSTVVPLLCVFPCPSPSGLPLSIVDMQWNHNVHNDFSECYVHESETGTDECAQMVNQKNRRERESDRQTDRQTGRQTDTQTDTQNKNKTKNKHTKQQQQSNPSCLDRDSNPTTSAFTEPRAQEG